MTSSSSATLQETLPARPEADPARGAAAYRRTRSPKQMEAEVFARATQAIRTAQGGTALDRARACADNRRLWNAVYGAVSDPANAMPPPLRAQIAGIAAAVLRECDATEPDLGFIAEVNDQTAAGLWR
jgi:flagellar biosynthesis regulator FlaF